MVECTGLENRRTARYRGFESLFLRKDHTPIKPQGLMGFLMPKISGARTQKFRALKNLILLSRMGVWSLRSAPSGMPRFSRGNPAGGSGGLSFPFQPNHPSSFPNLIYIPPLIRTNNSKFTFLSLNFTEKRISWYL